MESGERKDELFGVAGSEHLEAARAWHAMPTTGVSALSAVVDESGEVITVKATDESAHIRIYVPPPHRLDGRYCRASMQMDTVGGFTKGSNMFMLFRVNQ
jgi:hypothetical protein